MHLSGHYVGQAEDLNVWNDYYLNHHPQVMARFPGIREIEVCTRVDWCGFRHGGASIAAAQ